MSVHHLPTQARVVVIGGGIVGCSIAYHLTKLGWSDVLLLEQGQLSSGTTWHAAGLVGQLRSHQSLTRLIRTSTALYESLEAETGLATGWKRCGSITVARTPERMTMLRRTAAMARAQGVEIALLSAAEAARKWPLMRSDDLVGAAWLPGDGKANPSDITQALARGARTGGARIVEGVRVTDVVVELGRAMGVRTDHGDVACEVLCIAAGQWSRQVGRMAGVTIPLHSAEHMYIVTSRIPGVTPDLPVMRDPDGYIYFKEEVGGLVMGGFEPDAKPWGMDGIPADFAFQLLPDDWNQFEPLMTSALHRVPALETAEIKTFLNGPESFTPDNNFVLGEAPETRGVFVAAGFNSMGIASAGGAGKALAEWIVAGEPTQDLWPVDIRRFARFNGNSAWLKDRVKEVLGLHYAMPWPNRELDSARPLRRSPLYDRLASKGAVFGTKMGWERANWFAAPGEAREVAYSFGPQNWTAASLREQRACRETAALFDLSSFGKLLVQGRDAERVLQWVCANDIAGPPGRSVYTALLNARGGFESDLTVARLGAGEFLLTTGSAQPIRDTNWIRRHVPDGAHVVVTDVTSGFAVLALMGPRSREILSEVSRSPLDDAAFPFGAFQEIEIGYATAYASRRSYVGELGWELTIPTEFAASVYASLSEAGRAHGLADAGYYALDALRLEKGYRAWGREITPDVTPFEAGLGFAVALDKGDFNGRDALLAAGDTKPKRRVVSFLGPEPTDWMAWGGELVLADGQPVGEITSAAHGAALGGVVALGLVHAQNGVDSQWLSSKEFHLDVGGRSIPVSASLKPFFDPSGSRMRG